jgi:hypothetical protein
VLIWGSEIQIHPSGGAFFPFMAAVFIDLRGGAQKRIWQYT